MSTRLLQRLIGATLALGALSFSGLARADNLELSYLVPRIGIELLYRGMGYTGADGSFVDLAGSHIISSTVKVDFTPDAGSDVNTLVMDMLVPVSGVENQYFTVLGSQLTESSPGHYTYALTTDAFNGEVYSGRFSVEAYGVDALGNPVTLSGVVGPDTGFYYTFDVAAPVPEPASAAMLLGGLVLVLVPVVARRRRRAA